MFRLDFSSALEDSGDDKHDVDLWYPSELAGVSMQKLRIGHV